MYTSATTPQQITTYLQKRFRLSADIIEELTKYLGHKRINQISYNKKNDRLYYRGSKYSGYFTMQSWLSTWFTRCSCCGEWFKRTNDSVTFHYQKPPYYHFGPLVDVERICCNVCSITPSKTLDILHLIEDAIADFHITYDVGFIPNTHVKGKRIFFPSGLGSAIIY